MGTALIRIERLVKEYVIGDSERVRILHGLDFTIGEGEFVAIMGPSGSGKSTLMNILGCLDTPTSGHYYLDGRDTVPMGPDELAAYRSRLIGFVFQGFNLLPRKRVEDNVALPLVYAGIPVGERRVMARRILDRVGLSHRAGYWPGQLSGGQQQRVAIARAMVNKPRLILADEPTGNLDTRTREDIMALFHELSRQGLTIVLVTHEPEVASQARRLIHVVDGVIAHDGPAAGQHGGLA